MCIYTQILFGKYIIQYTTIFTISHNRIINAATSGFSSSVSFLMGFYQWNQFLKRLLVSCDMSVESGYQSESSLTSIVEKGEYPSQSRFRVGGATQVLIRSIQECLIVWWSNSVVDRSSMKSVSSDFRLIVGIVGLHTSVSQQSAVQSLQPGKSLSRVGDINRVNGTCSSVRYQV